MRQLSFEETNEASGGVLNCGNLNLSLGLTGMSVSGRLNDWIACGNSIRDTFNGYLAHERTGIPYGAAHIA